MGENEQSNDNGIPEEILPRGKDAELQKLGKETQGPEK